MASTKKVSRWTSLASLFIAALLVSCGGGGGGGAGVGPVALAPMVDSFGQLVPEAGFAGGDSGASGGDGTAGDGAPIANATVTIVDSTGRSITGKTDAQGYFRLRIDGFVPPMIGNVLRPDGSRWYSPSLTATKVRGFITINMTGLTDYVASQVAQSAGKSGAAELTPAILAANSAAVQIAKNELATQLATQIQAAGLNPSTFDPVTLPFRPDGLTGYDAVLENVVVQKSPSGSTTLTPKYALGGSISGLGSAGLVLANGGQSLNVAAGATTFTFATGLTAGTAYNVTIAQQPSFGTCALSNGAGTMGTTPVTNVSLVCNSTTRSVGGLINGLGNRTGLTLALGSQTLLVGANATSFAFPNLPQGSSYSVAVQSQPAGATCSVSSGDGVVGTVNVTTVVVTCSGTSFSLGGAISGLTGTGLVLANGGQTVAPSPGGTSFTFPTPVASGSNYSVTVQQQPAGQTCSVSNGSGTMSTGAVSSVSVSCASGNFTLGGTITGLGSAGLVLASGRQSLDVPAGATSYTFATPIPSGSSYNVVIQSQPVGTICLVSNGTGTVGTAPVTSVSVACSNSGGTLGGSISGLSSAGMVLATNTGQTLAVNAGATSFTFGQKLPAGASYVVSVQTQPTAGTCSVSNASGTMPNAAVTNVAVVCSDNLFTIGGSITGLISPGLILSTNGQNVFPAANATSFVFPTPLANGVPYSVVVAKQPDLIIGFAGTISTTCSVSNGAGVVAGAQVTNVLVTCVNGTLVSYYKPLGTLQCVPSDSTALLSALVQQLFTLTPKVVSSCGRDGLAHLAICGAPDGQIGIFDVSSQVTPGALAELGFFSLSNLPTATRVNCPPAPAPG